MKSIVVLFAVVALCAASDFYDGPPVRKCPQGEHSVLYCPRKAEPDCITPTVHERKTPGACDIPDCFCNTPTVRDLSTGKCVKLEDCPKKRCV